MSALRKCCLCLAFLFAAGSCPAADALWLTPEQKLRAEQLTSLFENDTIKLQYGYCTELGDGRGYTAGRAGFTTSTDEVYQVMKIYCEKKPGNVLQPYLQRIAYLADQESAETTGLKGFKQAWKVAADDSVFCTIQDELVDKLFCAPVAQWSQTLHLRTALAKAALYDAVIQHGNDGDHDGLPAMLNRTRQLAGGTPVTGVDEKVWLKAFLKVRRQTLTHADDPETRKEWAQSLGRVEIFENLVKQGNYDLHGPIKIETDDYTATIP